MSDKLKEICAHKQEEVRAKQARIPLAELQARLQDDAPELRPFCRELKHYPLALIAEIKKASPSRGMIRNDFDPAKLAQIYERAGASCLSVLTDYPYFRGDNAHLQQARAATSRPVLRKDFIIDPYQVYESRMLGADCILLIMAALDEAQAQDLHALGQELGMDVLVEVHTAAELQSARYIRGCGLIGVNNRDLTTLQVNIATAHALIPDMPDSVLAVAESGITDHQTLMQLYNSSYSAFLVGEHLMRADDIEKATYELIHGTQ